MTDGTTFDLRKTYVTLGPAGAAERIEVTDAFWADLGQGKRRLDGYLMIVSDVGKDTPHWERHPKGEEILYLLAGKLDVIIEREGGEQRVPLRSDAPGVVIPAGAWHRTEVVEPGRLMFVTWGEGTEHRPL